MTQIKNAWQYTKKSPPWRIGMLIMIGGVLIAGAWVWVRQFPTTAQGRSYIIRTANVAPDTAETQRAHQNAWENSVRIMEELSARRQVDVRDAITRIEEDVATRAARTRVLTPVQEQRVARAEFTKIAQLNEPIAPPHAGEQHLRIGLINDIHARGSNFFGNDSVRTLKPRWIARLGFALTHYHTVSRPHMIITPGDIIEGTKHPAHQGIEELRAVKRMFDRSPIPTYYGLGNHDLRSVTKTLFQDVFGMTERHLSVIAGDYKIIIADSNFHGDFSGRDIYPDTYYTRGFVSPSELFWLEEQLRTDPDKIKIVFIHHPPLTEAPAKPPVGLMSNARAVQELFSFYHVAAVFSGHIERYYHAVVDDVHYYVTPGLVKSAGYTGAFADIRLQGRASAVAVHYINRVTGKYTTSTLSVLPNEDAHVVDQDFMKRNAATEVNGGYGVQNPEEEPNTEELADY